MRIACGETPAYIPTSVNELLSTIDMVNTSAGGSSSQKLRIGIARTEPSTWTSTGKDDKTLLRLYTDYQRFNETYFWSNIVRVSMALDLIENRLFIRASKTN